MVLLSMEKKYFPHITSTVWAACTAVVVSSSFVFAQPYRGVTIWWDKFTLIIFSAILDPKYKLQ